MHLDVQNPDQEQTQTKVHTELESLAHDLNNLLGAGLAHASLAIRKLPDDNPAQVHLAKTVEYLKRTAAHLRDYTEANRLGSFVAIDLNGLIVDLVQQFEHRITTRANIEISLAEKLPKLLGNREQLAQIFVNLIVNIAEDEMLDSERILIRTSTQRFEADEISCYLSRSPLGAGQYVSMQIYCDNTPIGHDALRAIFEPHFTTKTSGRGVGLVSTMEILQSHHGGIFISSGQDNGFSVEVLLPAN
ncbi:MAG: ATP-binding protein [Caldilineaceae bacterium]